MTAPAATALLIHFQQLNKWFGTDFHVLRDIDLDIARGERVVVCGPSGSGKWISSAASMRWNRSSRAACRWRGCGCTPRPEDERAIAQVRRHVGMVFQQFNLFPHFRRAR